MTSHPDDCDCWHCQVRPVFEAGFRLGLRRGRDSGWRRGFEAAGHFRRAEAQVAAVRHHPEACPCGECVEARAAFYLWLEIGH